MGVFLLEENSTLTYTRKDDHHENKNFVIIFLHISWSSVFQQYHRTKIWISSHQKWSFELENNILALNMIDITVMSSQTQNHSPKPKCRCQFALSSLSQMPCDCMPRVCLLRMMMELECLLAVFLTFWRTNEDDF